MPLFLPHLLPVFVAVVDLLASRLLGETGLSGWNPVLDPVAIDRVQVSTRFRLAGYSVRFPMFQLVSISRQQPGLDLRIATRIHAFCRSEERRVGKEC